MTEGMSIFLEVEDAQREEWSRKELRELARIRQCRAGGCSRLAVWPADRCKIHE